MKISSFNWLRFWVCALVLVTVFCATKTCRAWTRTDTIRVTQTSDDGRLVGSTFGTTETSNYWGRFSDGSNLSAFFRMINTVPAGRTIDSVIPIIQAYSISGTDSSFIKFANQNDPSAPTSTATWNAITMTSDSVQYYGGGTWTTGTRYRGPDCKVPYRAAYNAGYCDSGEAVILFILGRNLANVDHNRRTLDYGFSSGYAFWLEITHSSAASNNSTGRRRRMTQLGSLEPQIVEWTKWEKVR